MSTDSLGRNIEYLRLSITDACNFNCMYCRPHDGLTAPKIYLSRPEIKLLVKTLAKLGIRKVRLTGGEPGVRQDLANIAQDISSLNGIESIGLTTNGTALLPQKNQAAAERILELRNSGISGLNVSLDSIKKEIFSKITVSNNFDKIFSALNLAIGSEFKAVKINVVLLKNINSLDFDSWLDFVKNKPVTVRFIELMPTKGAESLYTSSYVSSESLLNNLQAAGWQPKPKEPFAGPAQEFIHANYVGSIGVISAVSSPFCSNCNRIRVTSQGVLYPCAFSEASFPLRQFLQSPLQEKDLITAILSAINKKSAASELHAKSCHSNSFAMLGG